MKFNLGIIVLLFFILSGCSNGKIEYREERCKTYIYWPQSKGAKAIYLVNTSKRNKYTFTLKSTWSYSDRRPISTYINTYTLNPGEEVYIDCTSTYHKSDQIGKKILVSNRDYKIVGELKEN